LLTVLDPSTQRAVPETVPRPVIFNRLVPVVLMVTPFEPAGVKVDAPFALKVPDAVSESAEVTFPPMLTVSKAEPMLIRSAIVLLVPILIVFPALPVPMLRVLALFPVPKLTMPVVPESKVKAFAPVEVIVPAPAKPKAVAEVEMVSIEATPVNAPPVVTFSPPLDVNWKVPVALPILTFPVPVVAMLTFEAPDVARLVVPVEVKFVNVPAAAVVAPIAVLLIPVEVVLK
jgi:hypothetical protein